MINKWKLALWLGAALFVGLLIGHYVFPNEITEVKTVTIEKNVTKECPTCPKCEVCKTCKVCQKCPTVKTEAVVMEHKQEQKGPVKATPTRTITANKKCADFFATHPNAKASVITYEDTKQGCKMFY